MRETKGFVKKRERVTENADGGFSLVELIIVIAIMAVLAGVVGTQVIPYIESTRQSKDVQVLSTYVTAGMSAYSLYADNAPDQELWIKIVSDGSRDVYICQLPDGTAVPEAQPIAEELKTLIAEDRITETARIFQSKLYGELAQIAVVYDFADRNLSVRIFKADGVEIVPGTPIQGRL